MSIPTKARKIQFNSQTWRWMMCGVGSIIIWSPTEQKFIVPTWKILGWENPPKCWWDDVGDRQQVVLPGDVRKYIQESILGDAPLFTKDSNASLGKLYVFKHGSLNHDETPDVFIEKIEPTGFVTAHKFLDYLSSGKSVLLIQHWIEHTKKIGYYKILAEDFLVTLSIRWPRTWSGSFVEASPEKTL